MFTLSSDERIKHDLMASKELHPALMSAESEYKVWKEFDEVTLSPIFHSYICCLCITYSSLLTGSAATHGWITRFGSEAKRVTVSSCSVYPPRVCNLLSLQHVINLVCPE